MFGSIGKVLSKGVETVGDFIPGIGDARAQERANEQNLKLDKQNREWMERMSNSAYQRAMADMKKAGLNPLLAYQQGGASVPTTTSASVGAATKTALVDKAIEGFTGISTARAQTQNAQTAKAQADSTVSLQASQTANQIANTEKTQAETAKTLDSIKNQQTRRELERQQIKMQGVKTAAAELANKGVSTLEKMSNTALRNTAKPSVNPKTLEYENPLSLKNFFKSDNGPLIKNKRK